MEFINRITSIVTETIWGAKNEAAINVRRKVYKNLQDGQDSLSFATRNAYCLPQISTLPVIALITIYISSFYESIGASVSVTSFFIALARSLDILFAPYMSHLSDSYRSSMGRRRPFCFAGSWIYALTLGMLLSPPMSLSAKTITYWFGFAYVCLFLSYTLTTIPYDALGPELTDNYDDRSMLYFHAGLYEAIGTFSAVLLPGFLATFVNFSEKSCNPSSCYSDTGIGESCLNIPKTGDKQHYFLFDPNVWKASLDPKYIAGRNFTASCRTFDNTVYADPSLLFTSDHCYSYSSSLASSSCMSSYCECVESCATLCTTYSSRIAYMIIGVLFSVWAVSSFTYMVYQVQERSQVTEDERPVVLSAPIVPAVFNTFRNRLFRSLLPAWTLDAVSVTMVASMMVYFVRYVIQPEYQTHDEGGIDCNKGVPIHGHESDKWRCKSHIVLGGIIGVLLLSAFITCPIWLIITRNIGKHNAWLSWSLMLSIVTMPFCACSRGSIDLALGLSAIAGMPLGAKFLSDSIVADIIDYDEFLTGYRNEAIFTMFKSVLPKMCSIPALAVPIAILNSIGHVQSINGRVQQQPDSVRVFCIFATIVIPSFLCFFSFLVKLRFPIRNKRQSDAISEGVGLHMMNKSALDPVTGIDYKRPDFTRREMSMVHDLDYFPALQDALDFRTCVEKRRLDVIYALLFNRVRDQVTIAMFVLIAFTVGVSLSVYMISDPKLFIVPTFCLICLGASILCVTFLANRYGLIEKLKDRRLNVPLDVMDKIIEFRKRVDKINSIPYSKLPQPPIEELTEVDRLFDKVRVVWEMFLEDDDDEEGDDEDDDDDSDDDDSDDDDSDDDSDYSDDKNSDDSEENNDKNKHGHVTDFIKKMGQSHNDKDDNDDDENEKEKRRQRRERRKRRRQNREENQRRMSQSIANGNDENEETSMFDLWSELNTFGVYAEKVSEAILELLDARRYFLTRGKGKEREVAFRGLHKNNSNNDNTNNNDNNNDNSNTSNTEKIDEIGNVEMVSNDNSNNNNSEIRKRKVSLDTRKISPDPNPEIINGSNNNDNDNDNDNDNHENNDNNEFEQESVLSVWQYELYCFIMDAYNHYMKHLTDFEHDADDMSFDLSSEDADSGTDDD